MKFRRDVTAEDQDQGTEIQYGQANADGETAAFIVRAIPRAVRDAIEDRILGKKRKLGIRPDEVTEIEYDTDLTQEVNVQCALYALTGSRDVEIEMGGDATAREWTQLLGRAVLAGALVKLDDCWGPLKFERGRWLSPVREQFFKRFPDVARWIDRRARKLEGVEAKEELGKD